MTDEQIESTQEEVYVEPTQKDGEGVLENVIGIPCAFLALAPALVAPRFERMFSEMGQELPMLTRLIIGKGWIPSIVAMLIIFGASRFHFGLALILFVMWIAISSIGLYLPMIA